MSKANPTLSPVLLIVGHPDADSFCAALADHYQAAAEACGRPVQRLDLGRLQFDPVLRGGHRTPQALEPDLQSAQAAIAAAQRLVFIYPYWWGVMPALLKGFIDRVFLPGFAFRYLPGKNFPAQLLHGRDAQLIVTSDTPAWYNRLVYGRAGLRLMRKQVLDFCGIGPVRSVEIGPLHGSALPQRQRWLAHIAELARQP